MSVERSVLDYVRLGQAAAPAGVPIKIAIVTNFTDDLLAKLARGMCAEDGVAADVYQVPFKQYPQALKDPYSLLVQHKPDITCIFFDVSAYGSSEFLLPGHAEDVVADIVQYSATSPVVVATMVEPSARQHGRLFTNTTLHGAVDTFNTALAKLAHEHRQVETINTNLIVRCIGERHVRDARGHYAFSQPFSHDFLLALATEFRSHIRARRGLVRKCIVVDLDNTIWGGVVGEVGPLGIALGQEYPGNAFSHVQRILLDYFERGIILAINSRNNAADVDEVFAKNPHMLLKKSHFASIFTNWDSKVDNLKHIANDLNIGTDSLIFIDDDPVNRDLVRAQMPEVLVPELGTAPEDYPHVLLNLDAFHAGTLTDEDKERGVMYAAERERKDFASAVTLEEYLATLGVVVTVGLNNLTAVARVAQMTQKTNQYNLTTHRYTEAHIEKFIQEGALVFTGDVRDKFGPYGMTVLAIVMPSANEWTLDTWLMSCRVMARGVEQLFWDQVAATLRGKGVTQLAAQYIPTAKNAPAKELLPLLGAHKVGEGDKGEILYTLAI